LHDANAKINTIVLCAERVDRDETPICDDEDCIDERMPEEKGLVKPGTDRITVNKKVKFGEVIIIQIAPGCDCM